MKSLLRSGVLFVWMTSGLGAEPIRVGEAELSWEPKGVTSVRVQGRQTLVLPARLLTADGKPIPLDLSGPNRQVVRDKDPDRLRMVQIQLMPELGTFRREIILTEGQLFLVWDRTDGKTADAPFKVEFFIPFASFPDWSWSYEPYEAKYLPRWTGRVDLHDPAREKIRFKRSNRWLTFHNGLEQVRVELGIANSNELTDTGDGVRGVLTSRPAGKGIQRCWLRIAWGLRHRMANAYTESSGNHRAELPHLHEDGIAADIVPVRRDFFFLGETPEAVVRTVCVDPKQKEAAIAWRVEDFWDRVVARGTLKIKPDVRADVLTRLALPADRTGVFRVVLDWPAHGGPPRSSQAIYGLIPRPKPAPAGWDSPFGCVSQSELQTQMAGQLGFGWHRLHRREAAWQYVEPEPGRLQFALLDQRMPAANAFGFKTVCTLCRGPEWAQKEVAPVSMGTWTSNEMIRAVTWKPGKARDGWDNYIRILMRRYPEIHHWEILNEPYGNVIKGRAPLAEQREYWGKAYVELLKHTREVIRSVRPFDQVVGICGPPLYQRYEGRDWYELTLKAGALNHMDVLSVHFYPPNWQRWPPGAGGKLPVDDEDLDLIGANMDPDRIPNVSGRDLEQTVDVWYALLRDLLAKYGRRDFPIWNTESSVGTFQTFYTDETPAYYGAPKPFRTAAALHVRLTIIDLKHRAKRFHFVILGQRDYVHPLLEYDQSPSPLAAAQAVMTWHLSGCEYHQSVDLGKYVQGHVFAGPEGTVACLWGTWQEVVKTTQLHIPAGIESLTIRDLMGMPISPKPAEGGTAAIEITEQPVWVSASGLNASSLAERLGKAAVKISK